MGCKNFYWLGPSHALIICNDRLSAAKKWGMKITYWTNLSHKFFIWVFWLLTVQVMKRPEICIFLMIYKIIAIQQKSKNGCVDFGKLYIVGRLIKKSLDILQICPRLSIIFLTDSIFISIPFCSYPSALLLCHNYFPAYFVSFIRTQNSSFTYYLL